MLTILELGPNKKGHMFYNASKKKNVKCSEASKLELLSTIKAKWVKIHFMLALQNRQTS